MGPRQYRRDSRIGNPAGPRRGPAAVLLPLAAMRLLQAIGRLGQLLGLGIPVFAMILPLTGRIRPSQMLVMLVAAVCCFGIGRILEGFSRA